MAMMISWVAPVNPSHPYLENDPAPSFDRNICAFHLGFSLVLQPHILAEVLEAALVVAVAGPGLMAPPPPGPGQHRFVQRHRPPDQPVQQPAHFGNRQRYQGFNPLRFSPLFTVEALVGLLPDYRQVGMSQRPRSGGTTVRRRSTGVHTPYTCLQITAILLRWSRPWRTIRLWR